MHRFSLAIVTTLAALAVIGTATSGASAATVPVYRCTTTYGTTGQHPTPRTIAVLGSHGVTGIHGRGGSVFSASCTLPASAKADCTVSLNDAIARYG